MTLYKWSQTAATDATADSTINWSEGQAPSSVNDSARAMMAAIAKYRDDNSGNGMLTAGTSTAYTLSSHQAFDTLTHMGGMELSFYAHTTNGDSPTLNVDSLGAFPINTASGSAISAGTLLASSIYTVVFNNTNWLLKDFYGNPYNIPIGGGMDYWGTTVPNSNFAFPIGQAISRTTYAALFAIVGTTYGAGDASTTFNLPDKTGRASVMKEASATRLTSTHFGGNSTALGAVGGSESTTLTLAQLPTGITSSGSNSISVTSTAAEVVTGTIISDTVGGGAARNLGSNGASGPLTSTGTNAISVTSNNTSGSAHRTVQPTIVCNYIMRII